MQKKVNLLRLEAAKSGKGIILSLYFSIFIITILSLFRCPANQPAAQRSRRRLPRLYPRRDDDQPSRRILLAPIPTRRRRPRPRQRSERPRILWQQHRSPPHQDPRHRVYSRGEGGTHREFPGSNSIQFFFQTYLRYLFYSASVR